MKEVKITIELFKKLVQFHLLNMVDGESYIQKELQNKVDSLSRHELYTKSKTATTYEEREKARQKYLDAVGMKNDFRW